MRIEIELTDQQADQLRTSSGIIYHEIIGKVRAAVDLKDQAQKDRPMDRVLGIRS